MESDEDVDSFLYENSTDKKSASEYQDGVTFDETETDLAVKEENESAQTNSSKDSSEDSDDEDDIEITLDAPSEDSLEEAKKNRRGSLSIKNHTNSTGEHPNVSTTTNTSTTSRPTNSAKQIDINEPGT
eukprot:Sdes_comp22997_c0_seq1m21338